VDHSVPVGVSVGDAGEEDDGECWQDEDENGERIGDDPTGAKVAQLLQAAVLVARRMEFALRPWVPTSSSTVWYGPLWGVRTANGTKGRVGSQCRIALLAYDTFSMAFLDRHGATTKSTASPGGRGER
jgi:hypothetical protein